MKRLLILTVALGTCVSLVGCGSDPREGLVTATIQEVEAAATKVSTIRSKIDEAVKKTEPGKTPDFKEVLAEVDGLKKIATAMHDLKIKADALKDKTTEEERKELTDKNRLPLNKANERVAEARAKLNETLASVEAQHKDALKTVREKLTEADAENLKRYRVSEIPRDVTMKRLAAIILSLLAFAAARGLGQEASKGEAKTPFEEVIKQMIATMDSLTTTLATIRDEESAKAAQADLRQAADKWQLVKKNADKLPPPEKQEKDRLAKEYKTKLEQAQKKLFGEVARVSAVPGGRAALVEISAVLDKKAKK